MPIPIFTMLPPDPSPDDVVQKVNVLVQQLRELLLTLDDYNFDKITANVMDVKQLSAITADLGKVTAGIIIGAYISTADGAYPRIDFSSADRLLTAFSDPTHYFDITTSVGGAPGVEWVDGTNSAYMSYATALGIILATFGTNQSIGLQPSGDLKLSPNGDLTINGNTGYNGTFSAGTQTVTVTKGLITSVV